MSWAISRVIIVVAMALTTISIVGNRVTAGLVVSFQSEEGFYDPSGDLTVGFSFTTNRAITIVALADFDPGTGSQVRLYDGTGTILTQTIVTDEDPTDGSFPSFRGLPTSFHVHSIGPVTLSAGTEYFIASDVHSPHALLAKIDGLSTDPAITYNHGVFGDGAGLNVLDQNDIGIEPGYFGPNFRIETLTVPEPCSLTIGGIGGLVILSYVRFRPGRTKGGRELNGS